MNRTVRMTVKGALFAAALAAPMFVAGGAKAEPRTHDGFYLQLATGLAYLSSSFSVDVPGFGSLDGTYSGIATPFELHLGGTVGPVVIGGGFFTDYSLSTSFSSGGQSQTSSDVSMYLVGVDAFGDIYPDPHGGFHVRPYLGYAALSFAANGASSNSAGGPIFGAGVGYDFWVGDEWSIGVLGRFGYALLKYNEASYNTMNPAIMATFTFN